MDWSATRLDAIAARQKHAIVDGPFGSNLKTEHYRQAGIPVIQSGFVTKQRFMVDRYHYVEEVLFRAQQRSAVRGGDIVMAKIGAKSGTCALLPDEHPVSILAGNCLKITVDEGCCDNRYVVHSLHHKYQQTFLRELKSETAQPAISLQQLKALKLPFPPLSEQKKIAEILSTWDEVIEQIHRLIGIRKRRRKGLMQQVLTGKNRLAGFKGGWSTRRLSSMVQRLTASPVNPDSYPVLSITAGTGFVSQAQKFSRVIAGRNIERYVLLHRDEFSFNKGNSKRYPQGCTYRLSEYDAGLVPNVFYSFRVTDISVAPEFVEYWFLAGQHNHQLSRWINTGVRNDGLLNLHAADFFNLPISMPQQRNEQESIADVLRTASDEISLLETELKALEKQKRGLMQKLLTGTVRVMT